MKERIGDISAGMPKKTLADGPVSQLEIVPFYDRTGLIYETLGTLENAVRQQILVTIIVVLLMVLHLRSAALISAILPLAVLFSFIGMRLFKVDASSSVNSWFVTGYGATALNTPLMFTDSMDLIII